ncbi:zinc finger protein 592 [Oryzias melastigma]|uniref:Zinc finger protein 592 n=1 Tax=Oryzias melastigma TaxID=30732 RepID=A0A3B3E137_ORYME|nr:zinc finger protein 592 [Oryzias melastigma]
MGDMKTPDFDDLLAAFDIPDATGLDAKEPIQTSHEETENQLKHDGMCLDQSLLDNPAVATSDIPVVSVIVKNVSRQESIEEYRDRHHSGTTLQNGFTAQETYSDPPEERDNCFSKSFVSTLNGESSPEIPKEVANQCNTSQTPIFSPSHFNSVSSPEPENPLTSKDETLPIQDRNYLEAPVLDESSLPNNQRKFDFSLFDNCSQEIQGSRTEIGKSKPPADISINNETNKASEQESTFPHLRCDQNLTETNCNTNNTVDVSDSHLATKSHTSKLSSCLEALVALNATKDPKELTNSTLSPEMQNDLLKASPKVPISPKSPRSPLEAVKRVIKPSDSPISICSDGSDRASLAAASGLSPAIPKVRIKTIKTTSGQIKRTVTSVLPESETDDIYSAYESSPSQSVISEDSFSISPHQSQTNEHVVGIKSKGSPASTTSLKALDRKSEQNSRKSLASCSTSVGKKSATHRVQKPKRTSSTAGQKANTTSLPKAVHLASLNLVPHSVAASVAARSASHQQSNPTLSSSVCSGVPLVHQVKAANPFPCTPVPNTAAGTLHRLLNSANPVPTYVPNLSPPPESNINLPPNGYCCLECGDAFGLEKSLVGHYGRRSVHIEVGCTHCAKTLVFFNKCALLAHAREHKNSGMVMQCTQLHLKPLSEEHLFAPLSSEPASLASSTSSLSSSRSEPVLPLYPDSIIRHRHHCVECNKQLHDYKALAGHYQKLSEDVEGLTCKVCSMLLPNKCSLRAHQRLHAHKSPYSCPECGGLSRSADIQKHVKENCLHYARKAWYKCLHCDMVFRTLQGQETHIQEKHCEVFYKCNVCPVAFKTSDACEVHLKKKHSASKSALQLVLKCSCEAVFKKKRLLFQHFHQNANKRLICVFKCPECNSVFPQKRLLMLHFKSVHVGNMTAEVDKEVKEKEKTNLHPDVHSTEQSKSTDAQKFTGCGRKKSEKDIKPRMKPSGWTCGECLQWFSDRESYVSHVKTNHGKSVKKYPCRHCEQSFNSAITLRRHIRSDHDGKRRIYSCWYCTDTKTIFTTSVMLKNHISLMHGIKNPDLSQMPKASLREYKKPLGKKFASDLPPVETQANHQSDQEAPSAKRPKTQHRCLKCGFTTDDRTDFQQHIPQHRTDESTPQCLHCGLCFTSALSLNRHLFIVHKVKEEEEEEKAGVGTEKQNNRHVGSNKSKPSLDDGSKTAKGTKTTDCDLKPNPALDSRERSLGEEPPP